VIQVPLPQLSLAMEEVKVARWLVADGQLVQTGQPIVEIETDKAMSEVEAPAAGTIRRLVAEGEFVSAESVLAEIGEVGASPVPSAMTSASVAVAPPMVISQEPQAAGVAALVATPAVDRKHRGSPAARRIARERGVDLEHARGSMPAGRITARDLAGMSGDTKPSLRAAVVAHLAASWREIPHIHVGGELDGTGLAAAKRAAPPGVTLTDLLVLATARALREAPELNGTLGAVSHRVNVALAVATHNGVVAPVIRKANELSLLDIARERARLVAAARVGRPDSRDLAGGTITVTNLGAYPVDFFVPIVSGPQIAMLAIGRLIERPFAVNGVIGVRHQIWMNVAIDHRCADGVSGARFLAALQRSLHDLSP
jgi:pyruvate/2-oxoglutarate dehydrogenase complex dihydrolipoamide acyltransferase (E2) component